MRTLPLSLALALLLSACGGQDTSSSASTPADAMRGAVDAAAAKLPPPDAPLKPGQSVQGLFEADIGKGVQSFRSIATRVADDIGAQMDGKLDTGEGRRVIDDANRKLEALGTGTRVDAGDVRDFVGGLAGKTFHDSEVRRIDIIQTLQVTLKGTAADGTGLDLGLSFDDSTLALSKANLSVRPKMASMFDFYESAKAAPPEVRIERFQMNPDGSYAITGSFRAENLPASSIAKTLAGQTLPQVEGRFDFAALPLKEMPKFGGQ